MASPFEVLSESRTVARVDKTRLLEASRRIEARALTLAGEVTMWVALQSTSYVSPRTAWVYRTITSLGGRVHLFTPSPLDLDHVPDTLHLHTGGAGEWAVLLLGERGGWGLVARDRSRRDEPEDRRSFDWVTTRDRVGVLGAAQALGGLDLLSSVSGPSAV